MPALAKPKKKLYNDAKVHGVSGQGRQPILLNLNKPMADFAIRVGSHTAQGVRPNNEDRLVVDPTNHLYMVADGMGGQEHGERASGLAAEIIPRAFHKYLAAHGDAGNAVRQALAEANRAIIHAGQDQLAGRRMGTTAVLAVRQADQVYVAGL